MEPLIHRTAIVCLIIALFIFPVSGLSGIQTKKAPQSDIMNIGKLVLLPRLKTTIMVPMRDGIQLATDVYRPILRSSPHGTILIRTPYSKDAMSIIGFLWTLRGWPIVIQDTRGRGDSEGIDTGFKNDSADGVDTLQWIVSQPWSNGKVATYGLSALGIVQYCLAGANPSNLTCQYVQVATPNLYTHGVYQGGEFRKNLVEDWLSDQESDYLLEEILDNENFTLGYWGNVTLDDNWGDVNIPAIHIGG